MKIIFSGASVFVWAFLCIILVLAFGANRSYGEASEIDIPFSDKDVRISFSADDWLDARELSFPGVIRGTIRFF